MSCSSSPVCTERSPSASGYKDTRSFTPGPVPLHQLFLMSISLNANVGFSLEEILSVVSVQNCLDLSPLFLITRF